MSNKESIISHFHNQKGAGFDPENGMEYKPHHKKHWEMEEWKEKNEIIGTAEKLEQQIRSVVELIKNTGLNSSSKNNSKQQNFLEKIKGTALNKILKVLNDIIEYKNTIIILDNLNVEKDRHDQKIYLELKSRYDDNRKFKHNILISDLLAAIKFIAYNFSTINEEAMEKWQEKQEEEGAIILDVKRQKFPDKIICPDNLNLSDREQIAGWAMQLADLISTLKKELSF